MFILTPDIYYIPLYHIKYSSYLIVTYLKWQIDRTDGEKPGNLTWAGEMVWLDNRGMLTAPVPQVSL